jgi:hypothetical protein
MTQAPQILLEYRIRSLRLPTVLQEYSKLARQSAAEGVGSCPVPCPFDRIGDDRPRTADDRTTDQGRQVPHRQKPGQLRLQGDPGIEQDAGAGAGTLRMALRRCKSIAYRLTDRAA